MSRPQGPLSPGNGTGSSVLGQVAHGLAAADNIGPLMQQIVDGACDAVEALGAYVEQVNFAGDEVEVVAVSGDEVPPLGTRIPYPGSLAEEVIEKRAPEILDNRTLRERLRRGAAPEACGECSALVVPLLSEQEAVGALVLLRSLDQPVFEAEDGERLQTLADMGAVAVRRALSAEEAADRARAFEQSERRFRLLVESVQDYAIFMLDPEGHVVSWNRGAERIKGYLEEEILGRHFSVFYTEEDQKRSRPEEVLELAARHGRFEDRGWRVRRDGSHFWANVVVTAIRDEKGRLLGYAKVTRDLTEIRRTEQERERLFRREQEARDQVTAILESITDAFFALDREWRFTYLNRGAREAVRALLRRDHDEVIGESLWDVVRAFRGTRFEDEYRRAMATQEPAHFIEYAEAFGVWFEVHAYPSSEGLSVYFRDVTERKQAEEAVRESEERLRELAENIREVFWTADPEFTEFLYVSPAYETIWGRSVESLYEDPRSFLEGVHPDDRERVLVLIEELSQGEASAEYRIVLPDGTVRWLWVRGFPVWGEAGEIRRVVGVSDDITERRAREEQHRFLSQAGRVLASSLDYEETLRTVAHLAVPEIADWCVVDVLDQGTIRRLAVAHAEPEKGKFAQELVRRYPPDPDASTGVAEVLRSGKPQLLPELPETQLRAVARDAEHLRILQRLGLRSAMLVPMLVRGRALGVISFVAAESGRCYQAEDLTFAEELAASAALAVENSQLYREAQEARERVSGILESITDAFFAVDREWRFTYMNRQAEPLLQRSREELLGKNIWEEFPEAVGSTFYREYHRATAEQMAVHFEEFFPPLSRWFEVRAYPSAEGLSVFFADVTERKRVEEGLQLLAKVGTVLGTSLNYRETLEGVARLAVRSLADFCLIDVLEEDGELSGLAAAHRDPGKEELMRGARLFPPPPTSPLARPLETGTPVLISDITEHDVDAIARDEEHRRQIQGTGLRSLMTVPLVARGHTLGMMTFAAAESGRRYAQEDLATAQEIGVRAALAIDNGRLYQEAERRAREEEALRRAAAAVSAAFTTEEVIRQIAGSALDATRADGAFVERIDIERGEVELVAGSGTWAPSEGLRALYAGSIAQEVIERGEPLILENAEISASPILRELARACGPCSAMAVPLADAGEPIGSLVLVRSLEHPPFRPDETARAQTFGELAALAFRKIHLLDESERRREELERVTESRARLIRGFSHDLKNPLGAADGYLALLEDEILGELAPKQKQSVVSVRRLVVTSLELINHLVELHRAEAGQIPIERAPLEVRDAAREIAEEYRPQAEAKGLTMELRLPQKVPVVQSDASRVRQILGNLISNAVKYTFEGGITVRVAVRERDGAPGPGDWMAVGVSDTGPGIPHDKQHLLFREFTRLDPEATHGAGLGLAISQRIAEALGGTITVQSEMGRGSTFTLWLPFGEPAEEAPPTAAADE